MSISRTMQVVRAAWITGTFDAGGIGPVCRYAAEGVAKVAGWRTTVVSLRDKQEERIDAATGVQYTALGLSSNVSRGFLAWLTANPQDIVITNDVSHLEAGFPYFPKEALHVIQVHDSGKRYLNVALRQHRFVDGVVCVARHVEDLLREPLMALGFKGLLGTIHNGAAFPDLPARTNFGEPLRLLFIGRLDPFKGIFDLVPILLCLNRMNVPVRLTLAGGYHELLERRLKRKKLDHLVTWAGRVPHEDCYRLAAGSDVFMMLSRKEPFGMVTIEAMSMGCVPIAYDTPSGSAEIIEHGKSGFLLPLGDFRALARVIQSLHQDRERLRQLSEGAMCRARSEFNQTNMADKLCKFLLRMRSNARTHPAERELGLPPQTNSNALGHKAGYQRLPLSFREWVRNQVGARPRLSYWVLKHWNQ